MDFRHQYPHLAKIGDTLREATSDITREQLPDAVRALLAQIERRQEQQAQTASAFRPKDDPETH